MSKRTPSRGHRGPGGGYGPRGIGRPVDKAKDFKGTLRRLVRYMGHHRWSLLFVFLATILSTVFGVLSPKILGQATTILFDGMLRRLQGLSGVGVDFPAIGRVLLMLATVYVVSTIFDYVRQILMVNVAQTTVYKMRKDINEKLARLPLQYYDSTSHGDTLSRFTNDVDIISQSLQQSVIQMMSSLITIIGVTIMMLLISPILTLLTIGMLPLSAGISALIASRSQKYFVRQQNILGELNGHIEETFTGHTIVKAYGLEAEAEDAFRRSTMSSTKTDGKRSLSQGQSCL
jgi:ATP-binding cassette subfamily B multidrug efflux pump